MNTTDDRPTSPYTQAMNHLHFTDAQKDTLKRVLLEELQQVEDSAATTATKVPAATLRTSGARRTSGLRMTRRTVAILLAAAVSVCAAGAALAAGVMKLDLFDIATSLFGATPSQSDIVNRVGQTTGISSSNDGVTISLDAIVGDRRNIACVFSVTNDDGSTFAITDSSGNTLGDYLFIGNILFEEDSNESYIPSASGATSACNVSDDGSYIQVLYILSAEDPLVGSTATARFEDLMVTTHDAKTGSVDLESVAAGTWDLTFAIDYEDSSVELDGGQSVSCGGIDATIDTVELSPIGLFIAYEPDGPSIPDPATFVRMPVSLTLTDGTVIAFEQGSNALGDSSSFGRQDANDAHGVTATRNIVFNRIYDLADIASITIGNVEIPVEQAE